ncbi:mediator of RNA polymerase II transcription subunit 14 [Tanacetum coccineum]
MSSLQYWYVTANMTSRLALGDACNLVFSAQSNSSIHLSDANCLSKKKEQPEAIDDQCLSKVIEDFKIDDTICDGEWRWLGESVNRFDAIFASDPPNIENDRKDKVVWVNGKGRCCNFSVSNVWEDLIIRSQIVPWANLVCFSQCILRHFFMMWLVVHKILKTHDTMGVWENKVDMVPLIQYSQQLASTLSSHETCFTQTADSMFFIHEGLQQARARIYDVPSAIKILLTRTYERLPKYTEDVGIHNTLTDKQQKPVLKKLDTLVRSNYLKLHYPNSSPWLKFLMRILHLEVLVGETSGLVKLEETRHFVLEDDLERRMAASDTPFTTLYTIFHEFCVPLIMDTVIRQIQALRIVRWKDVIRFELISDGYQGQVGGNSHIRQAGGDVLHTGLNEPGSKDNKLELPRLALVKIRLEDKPSSITWEEKNQPDGPGSEYLVSYLSGDQSFAEGDSDRPVCSDDIRSPEIITTVKLELNSFNFPDMCAKETHSCLLKSHFKNVTSLSQWMFHSVDVGDQSLETDSSLKLYEVTVTTVNCEISWFLMMMIVISDGDDDYRWRMVAISDDYDGERW